MLVAVAGAAVAFTIAFILLPEAWALVKEYKIPASYLRISLYTALLIAATVLALVGLYLREGRD